MIEKIYTGNTLSKVKACCGDDVWLSFQEKTKTGILTSEMCYTMFKDTKEDFDFSAAVVPIMKGLELELKKVFYEPYYEYVTDNYDPKSYAQAICPSSDLEDKEKAKQVAVQKGKILYYKNGKFQFKRLSTEFSIGNFRYLTTHGDKKRIEIDEIFVEFCEKKLFAEQTIARKKIEKWVRELIINIEPLRKLRNDSAHAGKTQNSVDAFTVISDLIVTKKLLPVIVAPVESHYI
ncbi:MAG: hypothetical protein GX663_07000 [Clostridiales bacterium]|nr:hypothetical protein [Clostridiales bacterium]